MTQIAKTYFSPLALVSLIFFGVLFQIHFFSYGGPFNSRNMFGWIAMILTVWALWIPVLNQGEIKTPKLFIWPLMLPVISLTGFLAMASLSGPVSTAALGFPVLLLIFGLVLLGGQQARLTSIQWCMIICIISICVLPQSFFTLNTVGVLQKDFVLERMPVLFVRDFFGFSQYNLMGSFLASLVIFIGWGLYSLKLKNIWFIILLQACSCYFVLILSLNSSKTGVVGLSGAVLGLLAYVCWHDRGTLFNLKNRMWRGEGLTFPHRLLLIWTILIGLTFAFDSFLGGLITKLLSVLPLTSDIQIVSSVDGMNQRWGVESRSLIIRFSIWYVAWREFLEAPLLGHGLGSFHDVSVRAYAEYGLQEDLIFKENLTNPHNLVLFLLVETGVVGVFTILGPYIYALVGLIRQNARNVLVLVVLFPILLHTQLELPYLQSSTHFWLFAIFLTAVTQTNAEKSGSVSSVALSRGKSLMSMAALGVLGGLFVAGAYSTAYQDALAAHRYKVMQVKSLGEILAIRFTHSDIVHPIVGHNNSDTTVIYLTERATREGQLKMLEELLFPMYEAQISDTYSSVSLWYVELRALLALGEFDKANALIDKVSLLRPRVAQSMVEEVSSYREETIPHSPRQVQ